jgi:hypothetical protein
VGIRHEPGNKLLGSFWMSFPCPGKMNKGSFPRHHPPTGSLA